MHCLRPPLSCSDIINSPKLAGELQGAKLGSLLPPKQVQMLEATFLANEVVSPTQARSDGGTGVRLGVGTGR